MAFTAFPNDLDLREVGDGKWQLLNAFVFISERTGKVVHVDRGFKCDGASIPRLFWHIVGHPMHSDYVKAAVIHDWLYYIHATNRKMADKLFLEAMEAEGCPWWKRQLMYRMVRLFSHHAWKN